MGTRTALTRAEFEGLPDDEMRHELSQGELIPMTHPKPRHTLIQKRLNDLLRPAEERALGTAFIEMGYELAEDTIRVADVSFLRPERVAAILPDNYVQGAPELVIEIVSPSNSAEELNRKVVQFLDAGAQLVWVIYPSTRQVHVYESKTNLRILTETDRLEAPALLPGWSAPVSAIFV